MNNKSFYIVFASALLILCSICFNGSYAYFYASVDTDGNNAKSNVTTDTLTDLVLTKASIKSDTNLIPGNSVSTTFTVENPNNVSVCFDLNWSDITNTFVNKNDLIVTLKDGSGKTIVSGSVFPSADASLATGVKINAKTTTTYTLTILYKDTDSSQIDDMGKTFSGTITGTLKECPNIPLNDYIAELASTDTTNLATDDYGNTRYIGADPNNYISFDGDIWRIIGVMKDVLDGTGNKEDRVKIIRSESIGNHSWDTSESGINGGYGVNEWSEADVMKLLNPGYESESVSGSLYWNNESGTCYSGQSNATAACDFTSTGIKDSLKNMLGDAVWNTGSNGSSYSYNNIVTSKSYELERSTNTGKICTSGTYCNDDIVRATTWTGKIGLLYPSDYGYATSGGSTTDRATCLNTKLYIWNGSKVDDCKNNDWLSNSSSQWTLLPSSNSAGARSVFYMNSNGNISTNSASTNIVVKPVGYLLHSVSIKSGDGSISSPFILE